MADTLEGLARFHETMASISGHPLSEGAAERARLERELAAEERLSAEWFRGISRSKTPASF